MKILIICTGNSCRSQMAAALLKAFDADLKVYSAGTHPSESVHPKAVLVMQEWDIDISQNKPRQLLELTNQTFDYVITVCDSAKESCPVFTGSVRKRLHIGFDDPAEAKGTDDEVTAVFRSIRNKILIDFFSFYRNEISNTSC